MRSRSLARGVMRTRKPAQFVSRQIDEKLEWLQRNFYNDWRLRLGFQSRLGIDQSGPVYDRILRTATNGLSTGFPVSILYCQRSKPEARTEIVDVSGAG